MNEPPAVLGGLIVKRALDIFLSFLALVLTLPLQAAVTLLVALVLGRPIIFCQQRPGLHGRPFMLYKYRTMHLPKMEGESDAERMTKLGSVLRKYSLDEIPTLINVLKGDMSLVGPRPLLVEYLERYNEAQARRHNVKPGVTGLAQINGRNAISWEEKLSLDTSYVDTRSFVGDIRILMATVGKVIRSEGVSSPGQATTTKFLGSESDSR